MPLRDVERGSRSAHARPESRPGLKVWLLAVVLVVIISGGGAAYFFGLAHIEIDPETLCPRHEKPKEVLVVVLDASTQLSEPQLLRVRNELSRIVAKVPRFGLVESYAIDRAGQRVIQPLLHLCNPGTGEDLSYIYQNPERARRQWADFAKQVSFEFERRLSAPDAPRSPIFEAVQATALRTFNLPKYDGVAKRLVLVSDLLHNVPGKTSHYGHTPAFDEFKNTAYFSEVRADLKDVDVTLLYLVRSRSGTQGRAHIAFWDAYFAAQGASVQEVISIYGDQ